MTCIPWDPRFCEIGRTVQFDSPSSGDETVPVGSARGGRVIGATSRVYYVNSHDHGDVTHTGLPRNDRVLAYALDVVRVNGPLRTATTPDPTTASVTGAVAPAGVSEEPTPLSGTELTTSGPVAGLLTDDDGRRTGVTDPAQYKSVADIPGSSFNGTTAYSTTFLTAGRAHGRWTATGDGEVNLRVRAYGSGAVTATIPYPTVVVARGAVLTLGEIGTPLATSAPALNIDETPTARSTARLPRNRRSPERPPVT